MVQAGGGARETLHGATVAPLETDLRSRTRLGAYRLDEPVGRGGMGVVYRAEHLHLGRTVALKVLAPQLAGEPGFRARFLREARVAASIHHPNVVTVYDAGEEEGLLYLAMQYVDGPHLGALLARGPLAADAAVAVAEQVAAGLDAAHAIGVVHRDVKPGNVLVDGDRCYLTDFGLTRRASSASALTDHGEMVGTLDYVAPEQIAGEAVDARADVYSLGCLLFQLLAGDVPFPRASQVAVVYAHLQEPPQSLAVQRPELPQAIDGVVAKALAKRREDRYGSCSELVATARSALGLAGDGGPALRLVPRSASPTLLVAAGEAGARAAVRGMLGAERYAYETAGDGAEALELARERRPNLVVLDWGLPGLPASEVCRRLRADEATAATRILALATRSDALAPETARASGADSLLVRPFSSLQLQLAVGELLGREARSCG